MALPTTEEELNSVLQAERTKAASEALKVLDGTTFKSLEDLKIAHVNAEKKISEQGSELGELRKLKSGATGDAVVSDDELIAGISDEERDALAELYEKNQGIRKQIDVGGKKAQAEALRSLREVKPKGAAQNPFKKQAAADQINLAKMVRDAIRGVERGSNRDTGKADGDVGDAVPRTRSGVNGYFKK